MRFLSLCLLTCSAAIPLSAAGEGTKKDQPHSLANYTSDALPGWLRLSGEFRTRAESRTAFGFDEGDNDAYALFRTRLNIELQPSRSFRVFFQGQDSRVTGLDAQRPLANFKNPFDVRQAYVEWNGARDRLRLTVGRQLLNYGGQRLIGPLDWSNTSRAWNAVKLEMGTHDAKLNLFASSVVQNTPTRRIDHSVRGHNLHGAYATLRKAVPRSTLESYLLWKTGQISIWTAGFRLTTPAGTTISGFDYQVEGVRQWGHTNTQEHSAWAAYAVVGYQIAPSAVRPRVSAEFDYASGTRNPSAAEQHTFDQLLGTNHMYYGMVDIVGWQNMRAARAGFDFQPYRTLHAFADFHSFWLDSPRDALYDTSGRATVTPRAGNTARHVGTELDLSITWNASASWKIGTGVGHLFPGQFLKRNSVGSGQTFSYVFTQYAF